MERKMVLSFDHIFKDAAEGLQLAQPQKYATLTEDYGYGIYLKNRSEKRVHIMVSGGGGYGPMWLGFAETGLADGIVHGELDCAPNAFAIYQMAKLIDSGEGILLLANNYAGDVLNNDMAVELLRHDGHKAEAIYAMDDISKYGHTDRKMRNGLHGIGQLCKIANTLSHGGDNLDQICRSVRHANEKLFSLLIYVDEVTEDIVVGSGFSGEPPAVTQKYNGLDQFLDIITEMLLMKLNKYSEKSMFLNINRLSGMSYLEGFAVLKNLANSFIRNGYHISRASVGEYFDILPKEGCIISVLLLDEQLEKIATVIRGYGFAI